jgi:signal transduction histidine kinase
VNDEKLAGEAEEAVLVLSQTAKTVGAEHERLGNALRGLEAVEDVYYELRSDAAPWAFRLGMPAAIREALPPLGRERRIYSVQPDGADRARVFEEQVFIAGEPYRFRVVAWETETRAALTRLLAIHVSGLLAALVLAGLGGYVLARRALAPVRLVTDRARLLTAERLQDGIPVLNPHDELGQLARTFNELFTRLDASLDRLRQFTADASHELRTPLTAIRNVAEVGLGRDDAGKTECLESILEEAEQMTKVVNGLLTLSRAESGELSLAPERVDLAELSREVARQLAPVAEENTQELRIDAPLPVLVRADPLFVRQALMNVVDNAIKHGIRNAPIKVRVQRSGMKGMVEVIDRGPGIPASEQARVFDRFYRADAARSQAMGGSGLGLSLASWAVRANGGAIELESEEGRGSTFRIVLPADETAAA